MNKEELNRQIELLKTSLEAHEEQVKDLQHDLKIAEKKLADSNKPQLTVKQFGDIEDAIQRAIDSYNFDDYDQYEYEMSMEYDNKVYLSHIEFQDGDDLAGEVIRNIEKLFGIADESDDTETVPSE